MKFSVRQILASAAGAVIAALIASSFGVTGTIIGVAIGSMAATLGTTLVSQSIERGQKAVKQAAVRVPEGSASTLLRRMGATGAAGGPTSSVDGGPTGPHPTEVVGAVGEESTEMAAGAAPADVPATEREHVVREGHDEPAHEDGATTTPTQPTVVLEGAGVVGVTGGAGVATAAGALGEGRARRFSWKTLAGTAAIVFILALGLVTAIELIANRATVFTPSSPGTPTTTTSNPPATTTSTTTSPTTSSTTSTTSPRATTSTTAPSTTTTNPSSASTTTTTSAP